MNVTTMVRKLRYRRTGWFIAYWHLLRALPRHP